MDSMWVSGTQDLGSIPSGATNKHKNTQAEPGCFVSGGTRRKLAFISGLKEIKSGLAPARPGFCVFNMSANRNSEAIS